MAPAAVAFDFNGTLSDDEPLLERIYAGMFAERGRPLPEGAYVEQLAGLTEELIFERWLGRSDPELIDERIDRYCRLASDGSTVDGATREAVTFAAGCGPVAIVSSAYRREIDVVVHATGLRPAISLVVAREDVERGKPDPSCYLRAADELAVTPDRLLVFEDTEAGVEAARAAGCYVVGLTRTMGADRLRAADELAERIDNALLERLLCS
jgi:beta-phosphoglucomutase